jgi:penicillin-binding protein 1A
VKGLELAGKTGTTNNGVDAWFCGYSPTIETIVWFGRDNNKPIGKKATGGALAAPAFSYYYQKLLALYPKTKRTFDIPQGVFKGEYENKSELYTKNSSLPNSYKKRTKPYVEILENERDEEIRLEEDLGMAEILNIEDDPEDIKQEDDPLHPRRKVPMRPVSEDSGELF